MAIPKDGLFHFFHKTADLAFASYSSVDEMIRLGHAVRIPVIDCGTFFTEGVKQEHFGFLVMRAGYNFSARGIELIPEMVENDDLLMFWQWQKESESQKIRPLVAATEVLTIKGADEHNRYSAIHMEPSSCVVLTQTIEVPMSLSKSKDDAAQTRTIEVDKLCFSLSRNGRQLATNGILQ